MMVQLLRPIHSLLLLAGLALASLAPVVNAGPPVPDIPEANRHFSATQDCVEPTEYMRKNHMELILHKRDQTLREGIRTKQYSLKECINCHVPPESSGKVVHHDDPDHFCNVCHTYAAVSIDCFECHRDTPEPASSTDAKFHPLGESIGAHHELSSDRETVDVNAIKTLSEIE